MNTSRCRLIFAILVAALSSAQAVHAADETLAELIVKCGDGDPAVRSGAMNRVAQLDEKTIDPKAADVIAALLAQSKDKDDTAREAAGAALNTLAARGGSTFQALFAALQDIHLAPSANLFLGSFDKIPGKELPFILKSLSAEHWAVRLAAARALGRLRFEKDDAPELKQIVAALIDALKDDNRPVRTMAAETLQKFSKDAVPLLLKIVKEGPPESQAGAAFGLGRLHENAPPPESVAALHALLKDAKGETRTAVIASLGEFSSDAREALPDLVAVLRDDSPELRITAALALEKISAAVHDTTLPVLFQALATGAPSHRLEIVTALDRWNLEVVAASVKDAAPALISVLDDSNQEVRRRAIQALVKIARGNKDALPVVAEALKHPQPLVRIGATSVFVTLGTDGKDAAPKLAELLQHDDLLIRDVAAQMLLRVAPKAPEAALAARLINEATAYRACKAYVLAQTRYKARADGGDYAQTLRGNRSLFESKTGAADLKFIAKAIADAEGEPGKGAVVYSAYRFKILKGQGTGAPGGAKSYVEKNRMTQGHALAAYPAKFDAGGRLTFLVSDEGTVYYKDLGADTATIVSKMSEFNPDEGWKAIRDADVQIDEMKF